jgi:hypothetical protein
MARSRSAWRLHRRRGRSLVEAANHEIAMHTASFDRRGFFPDAGFDSREPAGDTKPARRAGFNGSGEA